MFSSGKVYDIKVKDGEVLDLDEELLRKRTERGNDYESDEEIKKKET